MPIESHGEQLSNAEKVVKLGIGQKIDAKSMNADVLLNTLNELLHNLKYRKEMDKLAQISTKLNGIENIKNIILSYS